MRMIWFIILSSILVFPAAAHVKVIGRNYQNATNYSVAMDFVLESETIGSIDPLRFRLAVKNSGRMDIRNLAIWPDYKTVNVEYRATGVQEWKQLYVPALHLSGLMADPPRFSLKVGECKERDLTVYCGPSNPSPYGKLTFPFEIPGSYYLRARYEVEKAYWIETPEVLVRVEAYQGADAEAYEWLKTLKIPNFMYLSDQVFADDESQSADDHAKQLLERFPQSRFTPWAKLYLANCYVYGVRKRKEKDGPPNLEMARQLLNEVKGQSADKFIQERSKKVFQEIDEQKRSQPSTASSPIR